MTWREAVFWLECIAYDAELGAEGLEPQKEVHDLDELANVLPKEGEKKE